jgi:hypothetical protein
MVYYGQQSKEIKELRTLLKEAIDDMNPRVVVHYAKLMGIFK